MTMATALGPKQLKGALELSQRVLDVIQKVGLLTSSGHLDPYQADDFKEKLEFVSAVFFGRSDESFRNSPSVQLLVLSVLEQLEVELARPLTHTLPFVDKLSSHIARVRGVADDLHRRGLLTKQGLDAVKQNLDNVVVSAKSGEAPAQLVGTVRAVESMLHKSEQLGREQLGRRAFGGFGKAMRA